MLKPSKVDLDEGVTIPLNPKEGLLPSAIKNGRPNRQAPSRQGSSVTFSAPEETKDDSNAITIPEEGDHTAKGLMEIGNTSRTPIVRIATEAKLKTITHKVKKPAVDIEFHDLVYTAKTTSGE